MHWLTDRLKNIEFRQHYEYEGFVEHYLDNLNIRLEALGMSREELAKALGKSVDYVNSVMDRTHELTLKEVANIGFATGFQYRIQFVSYLIKGRPHAKARDEDQKP